MQGIVKKAVSKLFFAFVFALVLNTCLSYGVKAFTNEKPENFENIVLSRSNLSEPKEILSPTALIKPVKVLPLVQIEPQELQTLSTETNMIVNGDFELDPNYNGTWEAYNSADVEAIFSWDEQKYHGDSGRSLSIQGSGVKSYLINGIAIMPGKAYSFEAWAKAIDVVKSENDFGVCIYIGQYDASGNLIDNTDYFFFQGGTFEWQLANLDFVSDPNAASAIIMLFLNGSGTVWFDDVSLVDEGTIPVPLLKVVADPGLDRSTYRGFEVTLDGSNSLNSYETPLSYSWGFVSKPEGSLSVLANSESVNPHFMPDIAGDYVISLTVDNGLDSNDTKQVIIRAKEFNDMQDDVNYNLMNNLDQNFITGYTITDMIPLSDGWIIIGDASDCQITILNALTGEVGKSYQLSTTPASLDFDFDNGIIVATQEADSKIAKINLYNDVISYIDTSVKNSEIIFGENGVVFAYSSSNTLISVIDIQSNLEVSSCSITSDSIGFLVYDKNKNNLLLGVEGLSPSSLYRYIYDEISHSLTFAQCVWDFGSTGQDLAISNDGNHVAFCCGGGNGNGYTIFDINSSDIDIIDIFGEWNTGAYPNSADFSHDNNYIVTYNFSDIQLFSVNTHEFIRNIGSRVNTNNYLVRISRGDKIVFSEYLNSLYFYKMDGTPTTAAPIIVNSITTDLSSPQNTGTQVSITANISGGTDNNYYHFWVYDGNSWTLVQSYTTTNTFEWSPQTEGTYYLLAAVKDKNSTNAYDAYNTIPFIVTEVEPVPTSIEIDGPDNVTIPSSDSTTLQYTAIVKDQYGSPMTGESVTWSLEGASTGVSINSTTGVVTVESTAQAGIYTVKATDGTATSMYTVTLNDVTPVIDINSIALTIDCKMELSWNPVIGACCYRVYYSPNPGYDTLYFQELDSSNSNPSISIDSLNESHLLYVYVIAYDAQMNCIGRSIEQSITGRTITGTIKLPEGCVAPSGGIPVYFYVHIPGVTGISYATPEIIAEGCSEKEYTIYIQDSTFSSCSIQYFIPNGYGYISGYYGTSEPIFVENDKPLIDISNNITEDIDVTLIPGKNIAGTVSLPYGTAPSDGLSICIRTNKNFGTIYEPLIYTNEQNVIILEGQSSADFVLTVPDIPDGSGYTINYQTNYDYSNEHIVTNGYYSLQGTIFGNISDATLICVKNGDVSGIIFPLLKGKSISGTVSLPEGVAPVGGMLVNVEASVVNVGTVNSSYYILSKVVPILEGSSSVPYSIIVPDYEKTKYKICYSVFDRIGYIVKGYYSNNSTIVLNIDQAIIIDVAYKDIANINLVLLDANSYINPLTTSYDRSSSSGDVTFHLQFNSNNIQWIHDYDTHNVVIMDKDIDYSLSGNDVIIKKEYLQKVEPGNHKFTFFCFNSNYIPVMIDITGLPCLNSTITPVSSSFDKKTSAQADISVTMTLNGNILSSIKNGTNTLVSGTDYTVSGSTVVIKKSCLSGLATGNAVLTFYFSAGDNVQLNITITDSTPTGSFIPIFPIGGFTGSLNSGNEPDNGIMTIAPICSDTNAKVEITADNYKALLDSAVEENGVKNLTINVNDVNVGEYNAQLPSSALTGATNEANITLSTAVANITLPSNMFSETDVQGAQIIGINVAAVDRSTLPEAVAKAIGKAPVVDISVTINGNVKPWNNPDAPVSVSIPYTLKEGENPDNITVFYIDGSGNLVNMQGIYDPETKLVSFTTTHFSKYMVKENGVKFSDLEGFESYAGYIESMAAKGIINGIGNNKFAPGKVLTRAEFSKLLVEMMKLDITDKSAIFSDVDTSIWYAPYVNAAYKAGLIKGVGNNRFNPDNTITTQDAALILVRALKYKGITIKAGSLSGIKDEKDISSYAKEAVGFTVSNEIMRMDSKGNFNAGDAVNRASAAEYIYKVFNFKAVL